MHFVEFKGHMDLEKWVMVDPYKIVVVKSWAWPNSMTKVRSLKSLASYYGRFVINFVFIATHLTRLTQKEVPFVWSNIC